MKKKRIFLIMAGGMVMSLFLFLSKVYNNQQIANDIYLMNIEALAADGESEKNHYWCCGQTEDCIKGDNVTVKGRLSKLPCF